MKKLLLLLLCVPLIGFGQDNCGDEPTKPKKTMSQSTFAYKQTKEYKIYKKQKDDWDLCQALHKELLDSNALYKQAISIDDKSNKYIFEEVVKAPEFTKDQLFTIYREWFVTTFVNAEAVLQMDDRESGFLIGKSFLNLSGGMITDQAAGNYPIAFTSRVNFTIKIYCKDGRFKYVLTDFYTYTAPSRYTIESTIPLEAYDYNNLQSFYNKRGKIRKFRVKDKESIILDFTAFGTSIKNHILDYEINQNQQNDW